jgi:hypothetical protein
MSKVLHIAALLIICTSAMTGAGMAARQEVIKRFAIIIGSNNGGSDRVRLRYAVSDARAVMDVLRKIGGVEQDGGMLIIDPGKEQFINSLADMRGMVIRARKTYSRVELVFYYSGHSDEEGVLLGGDKIYYHDIKEAVVSIPADVRIAILDSCASGAFTSIKGGKIRSPFLTDRSRSMKGFAFMTSSSSDEASQESDRIQGSFFTHYFLTGLRGAADLAGDGRITLNEAYQFAYAETLAHTEKTLRGPQHPNYHIMMSGAGDVVLTDIRKSSSTLVLSKPIYGRIFLRDGKKTLVAEMNKNTGRPVTLGLENGNYTVLNDRDGKLYEARVTLLEGSSYTLTYNSFAVVDKEYTRSRGDEAPEKEDATGGGNTTQNDSSEEKIRTGGFLDSIIRISLFGEGGIMSGGVISKERRVFRAYKPDLILANGFPHRYSQYAGFASSGIEMDLMPPSIKFNQKRGFDFTGIKFGIRGRYGYEYGASLIKSWDVDEGFYYGYGIQETGRLMQYHYWSAGPVMNFVFTPRNNVFNFMISIYGMAGQVFSGNLTPVSSLRGSQLLMSRLAGAWNGFWNVPAFMGWANLYTLKAFNNTGFSGYTVRFGIGPEFSLNKYFPIIVGLHLTFAYTGLTFDKAPLIYADGHKKSAHSELGGELSIGVHF